MTPRAALERGVGELGVDLPQDAQDKLLRYIALIEKWNRTYNLTAIRAPADMVRQHLLDSLSVLPHLPLGEEARLADVGSGAGLPGIPLAIARPRWRVALNDASQKKAAFLRQAAIELALANVEVHEGRVEDWAPQPKFALVISRAFAELGELRSRCVHLLGADGVLATMSGAAPLASGCRVIALKVPLVDAQRHLVLCPAGG